METTDNKPAGFTGEKHPEVFDRLQRKGPLKTGQLSKSQIDEYYEIGYTIVRDFFSVEEIEAVRKSVDVLVDELATRLFQAGKIKSTHQELGFNERLTALEKEFPGANVILHRSGKMTPEMLSIAANERILNLLEDFIGPDIAFNPVWNLRTKTPNNEQTVVPWHQDCAYFDRNSYNLQIMTAWIPLVHATKQNGTMEFVRNCQKEATVAMHTCCAGPTWYVMLDEEEMTKSFGCDLSKDSEILDIPVGSFVLFNNFTPHRSLTNTSQEIRWALDFRWQKADTPGCLFGLKDPCLLRTSADPKLSPDWESFNGVDRNSEQDSSMGKAEEDFNTAISGPWMKSWNIVNHNRHTDSFVDDTTTWHANMVHG